MDGPFGCSIAASSKAFPEILQGYILFYCAEWCELGSFKHPDMEPLKVLNDTKSILYDQESEEDHF